jgi:acyl carrier protein
MGLDGIELIQNVEATFKIDISNPEGSATITAGDLHNLVMSKLEPAASTGCLTSHAFYRVRAAVIRLTAHPRGTLLPATNTESIWPAETRRQAWRALSNEVGLEFPPLQRPAVVVNALMVTGCLVALVSALLFASTFPQIRASGRLLLTALMVTGVTCALVLATRPLARTTGPTVETLGALARTLVSRNFATLVGQRRQWVEAEVWDVIQNLIVETLGVHKDEVTRDTRFVEDLGVD